MIDHGKEGKPFRAVFMDRDGTMARDVHYCTRPEDFHLFPTTSRAIRLLKEHGLKVIVITNQSGIARGYLTEETLAKIHQKMKDGLAREGAFVDAIYYCPHHLDDGCQCRKPRPGLVLRAAKEHNIDVKRSFVVGDLKMDIDLGKALGCKTVLVRPSNPPPLHSPEEPVEPDERASDLLEAVHIILKWQGDESSNPGA